MGHHSQGQKLRSKIGYIVSQLQKDGQVHFGYPVGFAGRPETGNKYYRKYLKLKEKATIPELVSLANHQSPIITVYAFSILHSRNYEGLKAIFLNHVSDTSFFWTAGGCTGFGDRVNWFMLKNLKPNTGDTNKSPLTQGEYETYCRRFEKGDYLFSKD
jgi:hypothetical protein